MNLKYFVGDSGYAIEPWMLIPYDDAPTAAQRAYNATQMQARSIIERAFGQLKGRFRCLSQYRVLHYRPRKAGRIVNACTVLHNIAIHFRDQPLPEMFEVPGAPDEELAAPIDPAGYAVRRLRRLGQGVRDAYVAQYF